MTFQEIIKDVPQIIKDKLESLKTLRERPDYHPEPSAFHHIEIVTNRLITTGNPNLICTGILHDICKLDTMRINPKTGHPTSPGHDKWASLLVKRNPEIKKWIIKMGGKVSTVADLCEQHMRIKQIDQMKASKQEKLREMDIFPLLQKFTLADNMLITDAECISKLK